MFSFLARRIILFSISHLVLFNSLINLFGNFYSFELLPKAKAAQENENIIPNKEETPVWKNSRVRLLLVSNQLKKALFLIESEDRSQFNIADCNLGELDKILVGNPIVGECHLAEFGWLPNTKKNQLSFQIIYIKKIEEAVTRGQISKLIQMYLNAALTVGGYWMSTKVIHVFFTKTLPRIVFMNSRGQNLSMATMLSIEVASQVIMSYGLYNFFDALLKFPRKLSSDLSTPIPLDSLTIDVSSTYDQIHHILIDSGRQLRSDLGMDTIHL